MEELGVNSDSHITLDDIRSTMNQLNIKVSCIHFDISRPRNFRNVSGLPNEAQQ